MALDEPTDHDEVREETGFRLIMNRDLLNQAQRLEVDYLSGPLRRGFHVTAANQGRNC